MTLSFEKLKTKEYSEMIPILDSCPEFLDLTNANHQQQLKEKVEKILEQFSEIEEIENFEKSLFKVDVQSLIFILLALKIAKSKIIVRKINYPLYITVVFAAYKEHTRILSQDEHPHGENFLIRKFEQLKFLFDDNPLINWQLILVDDGCPEGSGKIAQNVAKENNMQDQVKVLFLEDAINKALPVTNPMQSTQESQKGGSICYGLWEAGKHNFNGRHLIVYTDADLSTHLSQIGLLIEPILKNDHSAAIGSRREPTSVVIKQGVRNNRGKLFIYLWKRILPNLNNIIDTQCGFKAFDSKVANNIVQNMIEKKFAFDIELLLKTELQKPESIAKVPIAWVDSEAASTTTDIQPYLSMLKAIVAMYRTYLQPNPVSEEFAGFIDSLSEKDFNKLVENIPEAILSKEPFEFDKFDGVSVSELNNAIVP